MLKNFSIAVHYEKTHILTKFLVYNLTRSYFTAFKNSGKTKNYKKYFQNNFFFQNYGTLMS